MFVFCYKKRSFCKSDIVQSDSCRGEGGGPLLYQNSYYNWMVAGISSFGPSSCTNKIPNVFTKVANYLDWIGKNTGLEDLGGTSRTVRPRTGTITPTTGNWIGTTTGSTNGTTTPTTGKKQIQLLTINTG